MRHAFRFTVVGLFFDFFCPSGTAFRPLAKLGTPARRAARRGRLWGFARQSDAKLRFAGLGRHRRHRRRAERHGYQSLTARQSRDLLLISGRVGCTNTLAPLASPPKHPLREVFSFLGVRGHASCAAGASLTRCARSGDLPPRRVNARVRFRFDQSPFQPDTTNKNSELKQLVEPTTPTPRYPFRTIHCSLP